VRRVTAPGLALFVLIACWGPFLAGDLASEWVFGWISGYLLLLFVTAYEFIFSRAPIHPLPFRLVVLGVVFMNFIMQLTGGVHSSLWPSYYLFTVVVAALSRLPQALLTVLLVVAVEAANLLIAGQYDPHRWQAYAGFVASLAGVSAATSLIIGRVLRQAEQAREDHERLIAHADALDPLTDAGKLEIIMGTQRSAISAARDRDARFDGLLNIIYKFLPAHTYALFLRERRESGAVFVLRAVRTESPPAVRPLGTELDPAAGKTIIDICAQQGTPEILPDHPDPYRLGYYDRSAKPVPVRSAMVIPIFADDPAQDGAVGVLAVDSLEANAFSAENEDLLQRFSVFFVQLIEKIQLTLDLRTRSDHFGELHTISTEMNKSMRFEEIIDAVFPKILNLVPADYAACMIKTEREGRDLMRIVALNGYSAELKGREFPIEESVVITGMQRTWQERGPHIFYTADLGDRGRDICLFPFKEMKKPVRALYGRLLVVENTVLGAFFLASVRPDAFTEYHRNRLLDTLMNQLSLAAYNSLLYQQIEGMARTDGLTGLLNHRTFMEKLREKYRELDRSPRPFSVLLMDIDRFKGVNDKYGHPVGDVAIKAVAKVLQETLRGTDFVARYGGEEFAVGMIETEAKDAVVIAERLRKIMEQTVVARVPDGHLQVTLSIGVAAFPEDTENKEELVNMADAALYHAKRSGRNRVCLYREAKNSPQPASQA